MVLDQQQHVRSTDPALRAVRREEEDGEESTAHVIIHGGLVVANQPPTEILDPVALFDELREAANRQAKLIVLAIERIFLEPVVEKQADGVATLTGYIQEGVLSMVEQLGQMLHEAEDRRLYAYHKCDSMNEWLEQMGIDRTIIKRALLVNKNASLLRLTSGPIKEVIKANAIQATEVDTIHRYYDSHIRNDMVQDLPKTATPAERRTYYEGKLLEYASDINAQVNTVLNSRDATIVKQQIQRSGSTQKAFLSMSVDIDETTQEVTFHAKIPYLTMPGGHLIDSGDSSDDTFEDDEEANDFGLIENGYRIQFHLSDQKDAIDYRDLPLAIQTLYEQKYNRARIGRPKRQYRPPSDAEEDWGV